MTITILQDHTDFFDRMLAMALNDNHGQPLSTSVLDRIRQKSIVGKYRGKAYTLGELREMADKLPEGSDRRSIARVMAASVEDQIEWFCIADDEGVEWLEKHHAGPVLRWNGAVWWGRLKSIEIDTEVVTHEAFTPRRKRRKPGSRPAKEGGTGGRPMVPGGAGVRHAYVPPAD